MIHKAIDLLKEQRGDIRKNEKEKNSSENTDELK